MRISEDSNTKIWASKNDTFDWAHKAGACWPCSTISNKRLFIELDADGNLIDLTVNGKCGVDVDGHELNAFISDIQ